MINNSPAEYVFIRICIFFLYSITPVALIYCLLVLISLIIPAVKQICVLPAPVLVWFVAESIFFLLVFLPRYHFLQRDAVHPAPKSRAEREELFEKCDKNIPNPEAYLSRWFGNASMEEVKKENVREFLSWAFFDSHRVKPEDEEELESYVKRMEEMLGRPLPEGKGSARSLRLTLQEVKCLHRSLLWYFCVAIVDCITSFQLWYQGYHFHRSSIASFFNLFPFRAHTLLPIKRSPARHLTYWHRPHTSSTKLPVLFIHGIGIGLYPYTSFLHDIAQTDPDIGIIALELLPISFRITHAALNKATMLEEVQSILDHHKWAKVVLVTHSYGSVIATHLIKSPSMSSAVGPCIFIDPITFLLHLPDVAHNFVRRKPGPWKANEHQLWYFASQDIGVAHSLSRHFFWSENIMWREELGFSDNEDDEGRGVTVVLGGKDLIVNTDLVCQYLMTGTPHSSSSDMENANGQARMPKVTTAEEIDDSEETPLLAASSKKVDKSAGEWKTGPFQHTGLNVLWFQHLDHAQFFDSRKSRAPVMDAIREYVKCQ